MSLLWGRVAAMPHPYYAGAAGGRSDESVRLFWREHERG